MDALEYLIAVVDKERELNSEFRDEMREWQSKIQERFASQDAVAAHKAKQLKILGGIIGTLVTLFGVVVPLLVNWLN